MGPLTIAMSCGELVRPASAAGHPVPGRALVDLHAVEGQDVGGLADLVPVVEPEGEVVQRAVRPVDDRDVVRGVAPFQPHPELVAVGVEDLFGHPEAEDAAEERGGLADLLGVDQHVVEPRRRDPGHAGRRDRRRVQLAEQAAGLVQLVDQLHGLTGRDAEPDRLALADGLAAADPLHLAAVLGYGVLQLGQVVLALDPEAEQVEPGPRVVAEPDRVVVLLVPALEVDRVLAAFGQLQAEYLGVVGGGQLKVGGTDVDVGKAQDSHGASRGLGKCLTRRTYLA